MWTAGAAAAVVTLVLFFLRWYSRSRLTIDLPSPSGRLPFVGHLHALGKRSYRVLTDWYHKHGEVYLVYMAKHPAVVLNGLDAIKEVFASPSVAGRPHRQLSSWRAHRRYCAFTHGPRTALYRQAIARSLAEAVGDRNFLEAAALDECDTLVAQLCQAGLSNHQPEVRKSIFNVIYSVCFNERGKLRRCALMERFLDIVDRMLEFASAASVGDFVPLSLLIPSFRKHYQDFLRAQDLLVSVVRDQEEIHGEAYSEQYVRDLCDALRRASDDPPDGRGDARHVAPPVGASWLGHPDGGGDCSGTAVEQSGMLLVAGYDTVAAALNWSLLLLAAHPAAQRDMSARIVEACGARAVSLADRDRLACVDAFVCEVLRYACVSPLAMPHVAVADLDVRGRRVPAGTMILANLWSVSRDESLWPNAEEFIPTRFLSADGALKTEDARRTLSFGSGCRKCLGEQFARAELFLFVSSIVQNCSVNLKESLPRDSDLILDGQSLHIQPKNIPLVFERKARNSL